MRIAALAILLAVMMIARLFKLGGSYDDPLARTIIGFGFLVFTGMVAGALASRIKLPRITGYLFAGMICGPYVLGLLDLDVVERLRTLDNLALALIAFTAGGELRMDRLRRAGLAIASITPMQTVFAYIATGIVILAASLFYAPISNLHWTSLGAIVLFFGTIAAANSPATAVAVIVETKSKGPLCDQIMGVTVLKDVLVIILTAVVLTVGGWMFTPDKQMQWGLIGRVLLETFISLIAGGLAALFIIAYLKYIRREMVLFVVATSLLIVFASGSLHLHFLLICMTAGFCVENFSPFGDRLIEAIERTSMTVYIIFFAIAGASINFGVLRSTWAIALALVIARAAAFAGGTALAGFASRQSRMIIRQSWSGYLGQAGVSLGIASLISRTYPELGTSFYTVVIATIAINQIVGPIALKFLLTRARETAECRLEEGMEHSINIPSLTINQL